MYFHILSLREVNKNKKMYRPTVVLVAVSVVFDNSNRVNTSDITIPSIWTSRLDTTNYNTIFYRGDNDRSSHIINSSNSNNNSRTHSTPDQQHQKINSVLVGTSGHTGTLTRPPHHHHDDDGVDCDDDHFDDNNNDDYY